MADLRFAQTRTFLAHFPGNHLFVTRSQAGVMAFYRNPDQETLDLIRKSNENGHHVFFTVNQVSGSKHANDEVDKIRAVFVDDDEPLPAPRMDWALDPSLIVETSKVSEGQKYHYYWLTSTDNKEEWQQVMNSLVTGYSTDENAKNIARLLRLPGYFNTKSDVNTLCRLVSNNGTVYEWDTIKKAFPPTHEASEQVVQDAGMIDETLYRAKFKAGEPGDITKHGNGLIAHWRHHFSEAKTRQKIQELIDEALSQKPSESVIVRYMAFSAQTDKFIKSITKKINKERVIDNLNKPVTTKTVVAGIPEALDWDWSLLKSNPIPKSCVPSILAQAAEEVGDWTGVGPDPALLSGVFITMALLGKSVKIHILDDELTTHAQAGICIAMVTGGRKSAIYEQMNKPFFEYEQQLQEEWKNQKHMVESVAKALETEMKNLDKAYASNKQPTDNERLQYAEKRGELARRHEALQIKEPWLSSSDVTEQKLVRKMAENNGCLAVVSDDARQVIDNLCGKFLDAENTGESVYINALTGSRILYERVGLDKEIHIPHPVLNALLFVQPDAALKLRNSKMFVPSGLAARLPMYFYPMSGEDIVRATTRRKINKDAMEPYYNALRNLCIRRLEHPLPVILTEAGINRCRELDQKYADKLANEWRGHYDKSNKLITQTLMYATAFASIEDPKFALAFRNTESTAISYDLPIKYINMGFAFAECIFGQSISSHDSIIYESLPRQAESFLSTLTKWYSSGKIYEGFTFCGALQNNVSKMYKENLLDIIELLHKKKYLYTTTMEAEKRKLNGGFPDKYVETGDIVYHLNLVGMEKRKEMNLDQTENTNG